MVADKQLGIEGRQVGHWRVARATRASVIIDADDYFTFARAAMLKARQRIMLIGWDFDARIKFGRSGADDGAPENVGEFIYWLVQQRPELEVYLLRWDLGALKTLVRGSTVFTVMKWMLHERIHAKLDGHHPTGASHHQKIVVIDDSFAFCGGIDMTATRWDTRAHCDDDPARVLPSGKPHGPWHDATTALEGPVAAAMGELARTRWERAGGGQLGPVECVTESWPEGLPVQFRDVDIAISRSEPAMPGLDPILEIETLYLEHIARAKRFIYAESQYFASRRIAEAMARRLDEEDGPEIVLINPWRAQGWLEPIAMDSARARIHEALRRRDRHDRFRLYHPYTTGGIPIYVHAKILVVDECILRVGSSNMNNRSMRLDTECDVTIDTSIAHNGACADAITLTWQDLLAEHLGADVGSVKHQWVATGSLVRTIEALRGAGKTLRPYEAPDLPAVEKWLADHEVLDPEGPDEMFEGFSKRSLFRGMRRTRS